MKRMLTASRGCAAAGPPLDTQGPAAELKG